MKKKVLLDQVSHGYRILLETIEEDSVQPHDYGISRQSWLRGVKFMKHFGAEKALDLIDERAERATERGDYHTARRWRDLITAIHAVQEDERLLGESEH